MATELTLFAWLHPSMRAPFDFDKTVFESDGAQKEAKFFKIDPSKTVVDLMDELEDRFLEVSKGKVPESPNGFEIQVNVLWNTKDHKKSLNPREPIGTHFADGETFGVYGDILPYEPDPKDIPESSKIPVTILTGFLGSGKTTLLNYILQEQSELKIAVIENEFGEVSIDDALLKQGKKGSSAEKVIVMDNGCMCCTIRGDLVEGLVELVNDIKSGSGIDQIIIETTGMADPVPIVRTFMTSPEVTCHLRLDGVVALADAKNLPGRLNDTVEEGKVNEAYQQIAFCDKIILNKLDLVGSEEAIKTKDQIREINKFAKIIPAVRGRIKIAELHNMHAHDLKGFTDLDIAAEAPDAPMYQEDGHGGHGEHGGHGDAHDGGHGHDENCTEDHGDGHAGHGGHDGHSGHGGHGGQEGHVAGHGHGPRGDNRHDNRVNSFSIVREGNIIPRRLAAWMQQVGNLPKDKGTVFRIKAILSIKDHPNKHVFHAVMDVSDEDDAGPWEEGEKRISKIVFIGKSMDQKFLRDGFESIFEE